MQKLYSKIGESLALFLPIKYGRNITKFFNQIQYLSNIKFVERNQKKVLKNLKKEIAHRKIRVAFLHFRPSKWKCDSLYKLFENSKCFEPFIIVSRFDSPKMPPENVNETLNFFKNKNFNIHLAYNIEKDEFIPLENFNPDIIFYGEPWSVYKEHSPLQMSSQALIYYVPYFIANVSSYMEYGLEFHLYLYKHFIINNLARDYYAPKMLNKGKNLKVVGHPQLDYFYLGQDKNLTNKNYVIYAPHWSINVPEENYATFEWNGEFLLEYAKKHPEINWVFKPHPTLKERIISQKIMSEESIEKYWNDWDKISFKYESGDYMDIFAQSKAMITDCGSFLTEYFVTKKPVIHLISETSIGYNPSAEAVVENYYKAHNLEELELLLNNIIIKNEDPLKEIRLKAIKDLNFAGTYAAENIYNDIMEELKC